eukprot:scaffold18107_cov57-Phaeocystis_antarctica.AAC.5
MDYSKWDSLHCDDDDDEKPRGPPRVTRLEGPARVTIGGTGAAAVSTLQPPAKQAPAAKKGATDYSKWDSLGVSDDGDSDEDEDEDDEEDPHARAYMASRAKPPPGYMVKPGQGEPAQAKPSQAPAPAPAPPSDSGTGAAVSASAAPQSHESLLAQLTRNGAQREAYLWRQSETEVELSVLVPPGTRAKQMLVEVRRPQSLATDERARVVVALRGSAAMLKTSWLGLRSAGSPEALSQRQSKPQAAPSSGQPWPISRAGSPGRPNRAWFRHSGPRQLGLTLTRTQSWLRSPATTDHMALRDATTQAKHHTSRHDCRSAAPLLDAELAYPVELATGKEAGGEEVTFTLP